MSCSRTTRFLTLVVLLLALTGFLSETAWARPKHVIFIRYPIAPAHFTDVITEFKTAMTLRGFIEGQHVEYTDILTKTANQDSIPEVQAAVERYRDEADMFITCGWVSMPVREILKTTTVPQLFVPVLESVALEMLPSLNTPPGTNISGIYLMYPPEKILRIARLIMPESRRYAYVYDSRIPADQVFKKAYDNLSSEERHGFTISFPDLADSVTAVIRQLQEEKIEAYGGIVGSFKNHESLLASGVPVVTALTLDIDRGSIKDYVGYDIIAGLFNPFGFCGTQAAAMTADIFDEKKTIAQTLPQQARQVSFINLKAARKRNLPISFDALEAVDIIVK
ncbi:MAG: hypothetical protein V1706_06450 [Pseudomonadota bacterium]